MGQEAHLVLLLDMKVSQKQCRYLKFLKLSFSIVLDLGILGVLKIIRQHLEGGKGGGSKIPLKGLTRQERVGQQPQKIC